MTNKFYLTTAIPYVNADPHVGFALEIVQADAIARYHRLLAEDVYFLTGTDENALKNVQAAEKEGLQTQALVNKYYQRFQDLKPALNLSYDQFIRTSSSEHFAGAQKLWLACQKDIYKKKYTGHYCVGCESFLTEKDLVDGLCPEHRQKPELIEEENYFFALSKYQKQIEQLLVTDQLKIYPRERKNEILAFVETGLADFSISRSVERAKGWGVPVPGDPSQIIYVWFDALANYITALDYAHDAKLFKKYWPANLHVIGKGITRFHAVYWPAMLLSANLPVPQAEFVHGYVTVEGQKISKSLGNAIDPFELVKKHGADALRYYLLAKIPPFTDGDFSIKHFEEVYNADLANGLGNLVQRVSKLAENAEYNVNKSYKDYKLDQIYQDYLNQFRFNEALSWLWQKITQLDQYVDREKPWTKQGKELTQILEKPIAEIQEIAFLLQPFLPETAEKIQKVFTGNIHAPQTPLFPRV